MLNFQDYVQIGVQELKLYISQTILKMKPFMKVDFGKLLACC